jgi:glutaredoxin-like YruB-family protein
MKQVAIYTTPTCHFCHMAKDYFKEHNIAYSEYDVLADMDKRREMVEKSGQLGVPVITIDNNVIVGFDQPTIAYLLGI